MAGGVTKLGDALLDVWVYENPKEYVKGQHTWVYCHVTEEPQGTLLARIRDVDDNREEICVSVEKTETVPEQFVSSIGTKDGITINEKERERSYWQEQVACDFKPKMHFMHIESSSMCNLRCQYCVVSNNYNQIERSIISDEVLDAALASVRQMPEIRTIQVSGLGEPLLNPNFCKMLRRIHDETQVRSVWFFTNGMLLTKEVSDELAKIPLRMRIVFSIDGDTPEQNGIQRRGSVYSIVRENILYFLHQVRNRQKVTVQIHNLRLVKEDEPVYAPEFLLNDFGFVGIDCHRAFYFPELSRKQLDSQNILVHERPDKKICKRMFGQTTIRSNGDVVRCHWDSACSIVMGNVLKTPLKDIWYGKEYVELRKKMAPDVPIEELPEACRKCHAMNDGYLYKE